MLDCGPYFDFLHRMMNQILSLAKGRNLVLRFRVGVRRVCGGCQRLC
jgi:hypothetical protein